MSLYQATMRATNLKVTRQYKKESTALRNIHKFLLNNERDPLRLVTFMSPDNPIRTFVDACELEIPREKSSDFYKSKKWLSLRFEVLSVYGSRCMCCGSGAENGVIIDVNHVYPRSKYPKLALEFYNMQVLCNSCNGGKSNTFIHDFRSPDIQGKLAEILLEHDIIPFKG